MGMAVTETIKDASRIADRARRKGFEGKKGKGRSNERSLCALRITMIERGGEYKIGQGAQGEMGGDALEVMFPPGFRREQSVSCTLQRQ